MPSEPRVLKKTAVKASEKPKEKEEQQDGPEMDKQDEIFEDDDSEWETEIEEESEEEEADKELQTAQQDGVLDPRNYFRREGRFVHERDDSPEPSELDVVSNVTLLNPSQIMKAVDA